MINLIKCFFWKSKKIPIAHSPLSKAFRKFSNKITSAMYVQWLFLKPNWYLFKILFLLKKSSSLSYINFSKILENIDQNEMGRWLLKSIASFALYIGETWAIFSSFGNVPSEKDMLASRLNGRAIWSVIHLRLFEVTPSFPGESSFKWPIIFLTSGAETGVKNI